MKYLKIVSFLFICFITNVFGSDADQLLKEVKNKFYSTRDFSANITQQGKNPVFNGRIYFKSENKYFLDLKNMSIISDGSTIWNYNKKENKVVINDAVSEENSIFSFKTLLEDYPSKCRVNSIKEGNNNILIFIPTEGSGLNFTEARLWINPEYLIDRVSIKNNKEGSIEFRLSDYKLNQNLPDSRFTFTAPEGSSVIDLR